MDFVSAEVVRIMVAGPGGSPRILSAFRGAFISKHCRGTSAVLAKAAKGHSE